jgi:hypothetical protein
VSRRRRPPGVGRAWALTRWGATVGVCAGLLGMSAVASANAPIALDGARNGDRPLVQYDPASASTFVAWSDVQTPDDGVELCVLPARATKCEGGGPIRLAVSPAENPQVTSENPLTLEGLTVASDGDATVVGKAVEGGSVAWESPADGAAFRSPGQGLQNGGGFISPVDPVSAFDNAVALGDSDVGLLDDGGGYWSDSAIAGPESPPIATPNSNQGNGGLYPGQPISDGPSVAAEPTPGVPGSDTVVAVGDQFTGPNTTLPGCVGNQGTGYGVDVGAINGQSNAAGTLNQGIPAYQLLACSAVGATLSVGAPTRAPVGVLENEGDGISQAGTTYSIDYRPFVATATGGGFGAPVALQYLPNAASDLALTNDSGDGVYAWWYLGGVDFFDVDYSPNGGRTWDGPVEVSDATFRQNPQDPALTAVGNGRFDIAFSANPGTGTRTYLEHFDYARLLPPATCDAPVTATATHSRVTLRVSCPVTPSALSLAITVPADTGRGTGDRRGKPITLASGRFTISRSGVRALRLRWNRTGQRLIGHHLRLATTLSLRTSTLRGTATSSGALAVTRRR